MVYCLTSGGIRLGRPAWFPDPKVHDGQRDQVYDEAGSKDPSVASASQQGAQQWSDNADHAHDGIGQAQVGGPAARR